MDIASLLNPKALAMGVVAALPLFIAAIPLQLRLDKAPAWRVMRGALLPAALAAGFIVCFAVQFDLPRSKNGIPWYLDEVWKLTVIAALLAGLGVAAARMLPWWLSAPLLILLSAALVLLMVRGPWMAMEERPAWNPTEDRPALMGWLGFAAALGAALLAYLVSLAPTIREPKLWPVGALVMWASTSAAGIMTLTWLDNRLGRLLVMLAMLAGVAGVAGLIRPLRQLLGGAWQFLALAFAVLWMLALYYNGRLEEPPLPRSALVLLACGPLGAAVAWIPALRRRPWLCGCLAAAATAAFLVPALLIAKMFAPTVVE